MWALKRLMAGLALACAMPAPAQDSGGDSGIVYLRQGREAEIAQAISKARTGLPDFLQRLTAPEPGDSKFAVEFNLDPKGNGEYVWATDLRLENDGLSGVLASPPLTIGFAMGQRVAIPDADIIDWSYYQGPVAQGHATTKVLLKQMPPEQAEKFRTVLGWPQE